MSDSRFRRAQRQTLIDNPAGSPLPVTAAKPDCRSFCPSCRGTLPRGYRMSEPLRVLSCCLQVIRGSGPGEVFPNVGRLRDASWELGFADEGTAGYAEALMEQHEAKARAHVCEVRRSSG